MICDDRIVLCEFYYEAGKRKGFQFNEEPPLQVRTEEEEEKGILTYSAKEGRLITSPAGYVLGPCFLFPF